MVFEQLDLLRVLQLEGLEIVKQSLHVMAALLGHTYAALPNLCYHLLVGTHDRLFPHQLQWRYQHWHVQSQYGIDPSNVAGFVGVSQVLAVPSQQVVELVVGCEG